MFTPSNLSKMYEDYGLVATKKFRPMSSANPMDQAIPVFTGDKEVEFRGNYETDGFIYVRQTQPLPLTILSLYPELITND